MFTHRPPPPSGATMFYALDGGVVVTVHADTAPTDADWDAYLDWLVIRKDRIRCILVCTGQAGPNLQQRARIGAIEGASAVPTAVVTPSLQARGMATALSWIGLKIRAFKPDALDDAFDFLDVPVARRQVLRERIATFQDQLV